MRWIPIIVLSLLLVGPALAVEPTDTVTLEGEYVWKKGKPHRLRGEFTAIGENEWAVEFHFKHFGKHVFVGTVTGSMEDGGELSGEVLSASGKREFVFSGVFTDATFEGEHAELTKKKGRKPTGTLTLSH